MLRHSTAHVLAQAVLRLWPGARYAIGPTIADGFYYDFELPDGGRFSEADLSRIEERMSEIVAEGQPFSREEHSFEEGLEIFSDQPYKREIIEGVRAAELSGDDGVDPELAAETSAGGVSLYRNDGHFVDLCRGPHVPSTDRLGHFKLLRVAGAYWRGDEHRGQLQRVYGTAWESADALSAYLHRIEEAERRDHRRIGAELDLFSFPDEIGSGLAVFHPKGGLVRRLLEDYSRRRHDEAGYEFVNSPHITREDLFQISGHLQWFADSMYPPMVLDDGQRYYLKPMNCPFHILIYRSRQRSYRELPLRLFEFGTVYRYEKSGVVHGLTRVRGLTQDDAHIFCSPRADARRARLAPALRARAALGLRPGRLLPRALHPPDGQGRRQRGGMGRSDRGAADRRQCDGPRARPRSWRRRVLRAEDLRAGPRCHWPQLADVDDATRLPVPEPVRPQLRRFGQRAAPPDHDPPRLVRLGGALLRRTARALRGGVSDLAGAGAGGGALPVRDDHDDYATTVAAQRLSPTACAPRWTRPPSP